MEVDLRIEVVVLLLLLDRTEEMVGVEAAVAKRGEVARVGVEAREDRRRLLLEGDLVVTIVGGESERVQVDSIRCRRRRERERVRD